MPGHAQAFAHRRLGAHLLPGLGRHAAGRRLDQDPALPGAVGGALAAVAAARWPSWCRRWTPTASSSAATSTCTTTPPHSTAWCCRAATTSPPRATANSRCTPTGTATACATATRWNSSAPSSPPASRCSASAAGCSCSTSPTAARCCRTSRTQRPEALDHRVPGQLRTPPPHGGIRPRHATRVAVSRCAARPPPTASTTRASRTWRPASWSRRAARRTA